LWVLILKLDKEGVLFSLWCAPQVSLLSSVVLRYLTFGEDEIWDLLKQTGGYSVLFKVNCT